MLLLFSVAEMNDEYGTLTERHWMINTEVIGQKPVPVPHSPPQIPHGRGWLWTGASAVRAATNLQSHGNELNL